MFETEMYVYYGTNDYNVRKLDNPLSYEPTKCGKCGKVIHLAEGGYSSGKDGYRCYDCTVAEHPSAFGPLS
jgi:tRNA(Ile2) C34 agmatinyltransferase TiaS